MAASLRPFDPFTYLKPFDILGKYSEWIELILYCVMFIAIAGVALPKNLTNRRFGRPLVTAVGLVLGIGLYRAKDLFNFSFESFAFMGIWMIIILFGVLFFGMMKGLKVRPDIAFALTYCTIFISFLAIRPTLFDAVAQFL